MWWWGLLGGGYYEFLYASCVIGLCDFYDIEALGEVPDVDFV